MPYELRKQGDKYCVINKETGDSKGCSDTREMGIKHMRALYAAEGTKEFELVEISAITEELCKCLACTTEDDSSPITVRHKSYIDSLPDSAFAYERHFPLKSASGDVHPIYVNHALASTDSPHYDQAHKAITKSAKSLGLVKDTSLLKSIIAGLRPTPPCVAGESVCSMYKDADGRTRVFMRVSNMFKDRHGEIITSEAHKEYVEYVDANKDKMPEFWLWHIKGSRWGQADFVDFSDGFLTVSGLVDEGYEHVAEAISLMSKDLGVSHGFWGASLSNRGFIDLYRSFEVSPLPKSKAANIWTAVMLAKEADLPLTKEKRDWLVNDIGVPESIADKWGNENKELAELLKENGIVYKEDGTDTSSAPNDTNSDGITPAAEPNLSDVLEAINKLSGIVSEQSKEITDLKKSRDDYVAEVMSAHITPGAPVGHVASKSDDNTVSAETVKKDEADWMVSTVLKGLI